MGPVKSSNSSTTLHDELRAALRRTLDNQRMHIIHAFDDLPEEDLSRVVLPTGWTYLGLVRHLTYDVERFWFRSVQAGESIDLDEIDNAWVVPEGMTAAQVMTEYQREIDLANAMIDQTPLDTMPLWWPDFFAPDFVARPLHRTILHVITETAAHAGHLDIARELIDGHQWLVLT